MRANNLRTGNAIRIDGRVFIVTKTEHTKPGKGPAYMQVKMKEVGGTQSTSERRFNATDEVEDVALDRRKMEYLYSDSTGATFMDLETFDQATLPEAILGDAMLYLAPNSEINVLCLDDVPVTLELPAAVELIITDTPPGIKGATVTNQLKEATCETGLQTKVPAFIEPGEKIKISTADGSYMSRAKSDG